MEIEVKNDTFLEKFIIILITGLYSALSMHYVQQHYLRAAKQSSHRTEYKKYKSSKNRSFQRALSWNTRGWNYIPSRVWFFVAVYDGDDLEMILGL